MDTRRREVVIGISGAVVSKSDTLTDTEELPPIHPSASPVHFSVRLLCENFDSGEPVLVIGDFKVGVGVNARLTFGYGSGREVLQFHSLAIPVISVFV
jgi:hypothetical protein